MQGASTRKPHLARPACCVASVGPQEPLDKQQLRGSKGLALNEAPVDPVEMPAPRNPVETPTPDSLPGERARRPGSGAPPPAVCVQRQRGDSVRTCFPSDVPIRRSS